MKKLLAVCLVLAFASSALAAAPVVPPTEPIPTTVKEANAPVKKAKKEDKAKKKETKKDAAKAPEAEK